MKYNYSGFDGSYLPGVAHAIAMACAVAACAGTASAQRVNPEAGTSSAAFLKIPVGARPIGMGEIFAASADDANAVYWNPAGLAGRRHSDLQFMHDEYFQGLKHDSLGYVHANPNSTGGSAWGLGAISLTVPNNIEIRSGNFENDPFNPISGPEGTFGASDLAIGASYARFIGGGAYGATLKFIRQSIYNQSAQTAALDLGWQARQIKPHLDVGAVIENFGPGVRFGTQYPLPLALRLAAAYHLPADSQLTAGLDYPRDDYPTLAAGSEFGIGHFLYLRAGYRYRWYGNPLGGFSGFRTGLGFAFHNWSLDYAFSPFGNLGNANRISIGIKFGGDVESVSVAAVEPAAGGGTPEVGASSGTFLALTNSTAAVSFPPVAVAQASTAAVSAAPVAPTAPTTGADQAGAGFSDFQVWALPRVVSARGTDYVVQAQAPSDDWALQKLEFRSPLRSATGLRVQAAQESPDPALPRQYKALSAYRIKMNWDVAGKAVFLEFAVPKSSGKIAVLALSNGAWKPLKTERLEDGEDKNIFRVKCDNIPEVIAIAATNPTNPGAEGADRQQPAAH